MKKILLLLITAIISTSCVSILNDKTYVVNIHSNEPNIKVKVQDSIYTLPVTTEIARSKQDLVFTLLKEPKNVEFRVKPKTSGKLLLNIPIILIPPFIPGLIGAGTDFYNDKKFHYGKSFYLNTKDSTVTRKKSKKAPFNYYLPAKYRKRKGEFDLHISIPFVNSFLNQPIGETTHLSTGFRGISTGLDYYHNKKQFLNLSASYTTDYAFIITEPNDIYELGSPERNYSSYLSLSNNHKIKRFLLGYGFSYSKNKWVPGTGTKASNTTATQNHNALGLVFPAYYQLGRTFNIGIIYRPTFYRFTTTDQFQYEHLISLDFAWKIKL